MVKITTRLILRVAGRTRLRIRIKLPLLRSTIGKVNETGNDFDDVLLHWGEENLNAYAVVIPGIDGEPDFLSFDAHKVVQTSAWLG